MKKLLFALVLIALCISIFSSSVNKAEKFPDYPRRSVTINTHPLTLVVADTEERKSIGLSGTQYITEHDGMLFLFPKPGRYGFWMKDMNFPIDLIYLKNNRVVEVIKNAQPSSYPHIFLPKQEFDSVIEVITGVAGNMDVVPGAKVVYLK